MTKTFNSAAVALASFGVIALSRYLEPSGALDVPAAFVAGSIGFAGWCASQFSNFDFSFARYVSALCICGIVAGAAHESVNAPTRSPTDMPSTTRLQSPSAPVTRPA